MNSSFNPQPKAQAFGEACMIHAIAFGFGLNEFGGDMAVLRYLRVNDGAF